jgi:O-antigen ligase
LFLIFILAVLFLLLFYQDIAALLPADLATLNSRVPNWLFALDIAYDNAVLGVGYFASREYLINFFTLNHAWGGLAHNTYIEIFLTTGILGLLLLVSFVIYGAVSACGAGSPVLVGILVYIISRTILDAIFFSPELGMFVVMFLLAIRPLLSRGLVSGREGADFQP